MCNRPIWMAGMSLAALATTPAERAETLLDNGAARGSSMRRRMFVSIHDVAPRFEREIDILIDRLCGHVPIDRLAMLVVPDHWGTSKLTPGTPFATRVRAWSDAGVSMFVHGWFHRDDSSHDAGMSRFKARHMTAGEGEFLGLAAQEAIARMQAGRALLEEVTGRPAAGFIAPAWLYGPGALEALSHCGFALAEDHMKVWQPQSGKVLARGPVITWASRSRMRIASSLMVARLLPPLMRFAPAVRIAVHPGDTGVPALLASIEDVVRDVRRTHVPARYDALLPEVACAS